jgi:hypothetical protein
MYTKNELLFPHYTIPALQNMRGEAWREMISRVMNVPEGHELSLALMLLMIRLNSCLTCETDSYRAMRGCEACAIQTLRRYKGTDAELLRQYQAALEDVRNYLHKADQSAQTG